MYHFNQDLNSSMGLLNIKKKKFSHRKKIIWQFNGIEGSFRAKNKICVKESCSMMPEITMILLIISFQIKSMLLKLNIIKITKMTYFKNVFCK